MLSRSNRTCTAFWSEELAMNTSKEDNFVPLLWACIEAELALESQLGLGYVCDLLYTIWDMHHAHAWVHTDTHTHSPWKMLDTVQQRETTHATKGALLLAMRAKDSSYRCRALLVSLPERRTFLLCSTHHCQSSWSRMPDSCMLKFPHPLEQEE